MGVGVAVPGAGEGGVCAEGGITGEEGGGARVVVAGAEVLEAGWVGVFAGVGVGAGEGADSAEWRAIRGVVLGCRDPR